MITTLYQESKELSTIAIIEYTIPFFSFFGFDY